MKNRCAGCYVTLTDLKVYLHTRDCIERSLMYGSIMSFEKSTCFITVVLKIFIYTQLFMIVHKL